MPENIPDIINLALEENKPKDKNYCIGAYILFVGQGRQPKKIYLKTNIILDDNEKVAYNNTEKMNRKSGSGRGSVFQMIMKKQHIITQRTCIENLVVVEEVSSDIKYNSQRVSC